MNNVMIPYDIFIKMINYHLMGEKEEEKDVVRFLERKVESMTRHEWYAKSKTAATEEERERNRRKYLDAIGMRQDFRW